VNSPRSPQGSALAARSASNASSNSRPTKMRESVSDHEVIRARRPAETISRARSIVDKPQSERARQTGSRELRFPVPAHLLQKEIAERHHTHTAASVFVSPFSMAISYC